MNPTNAETVMSVMTSTKDWRTASDVAWHVRRAGWVMSTGKARNVLNALTRTGQIESFKKGNRYYFRKAA
jgi:Fe2+ or Zn2+ uptake regulation protein